MMHDANLDPFFDRLACVNPFLENRVNGPTPASVDVADIHKKAFERLTGYARQALVIRRGFGAVLWGEAGVGKSHLLARLASWAGEGKAVFVYLHNLQAAPEALPRSFLYAVLTELTQGRRAGFQNTVLFELARAGVIEAAGRLASFSWTELEYRHQAWLDRLGPAGGDRLIHEVLYAFFRSVSRAMRGREDGSVAGLAARWLAGGALEAAEARLLGLPPGPRRDEPTALADAQEIKQVLIVLSRLAISLGRPFILALDQVDNLDREQFAALSRFLEALLDSAEGMLVITCGVQPTLMSWREEGIVQMSAWDRIAQFQVRLEALSPAQAEQLLRSRIGAFLDSFTWLKAVNQARTADPLFPLGRSWANRYLLSRPDFRARDVLSLARDAWQREQNELARLGRDDWLVSWPHVPSGEAVVAPTLTLEQIAARINDTVAEEMQTFRNRLRDEPAEVPPDGDRLASVVYDLLSWAGAVEGTRPPADLQRLPPPRAGASPTYHFLFRQGKGESQRITGVLVLTARNATSAAGFLRRLDDHSDPLDRVVVITDDRVGMPLGVKGREYLTRLEQCEVPELERVELSFAEVVALEALNSVVRRARAGDIEIDLRPGSTRKVTPDEVRGCAAWQRLFLEQRLLRVLLGIQAEVAAAG